MAAPRPATLRSRSTRGLRRVPVRVRGWQRQMSDIRQARKALVARILDGPGEASPTQPRAAFTNAGLPEPLVTMVDKVAKHACQVADEDIASVRKAGFTEDQIYEFVVCAAIGQATRQYEAALAALEAATGRSEHAPRDPR